jgi:hypothetical protein
MHSNRQILGHNLTATGTHLRCASGVDQYDSATGAFSLVRAVLHKSSPGHVRNTPVDDLVSVRLHVLNVQVFKHQQAVAVNQLATFLMYKVVPAIARPLIGVVECLDRFSAFCAALWQFLFFALKAGNIQSVLLHPALTVNLLAVGQHYKRLQSEVNAYDFIRQRQWVRRDFTRKTGVPFSRTALNGDGLDFAVYRTVHDDTHLADFGQRECIAFQFRAIPVLRIGETGVLAAALKAWIAWLVASFHPAEKRLKRQINPYLHILQDLRMYGLQWREVRLPHGQQFCRRVIVQRFAALLVGIPACCQRGIVDRTAQFKRLLKLRALRTGWFQAVFVSQSHALSVTQMRLKYKVLRLISPDLKVGVLRRFFDNQTPSQGDRFFSIRKFS